MQAKTANVLIGGMNPLATDTVATAVMGYDATASSSEQPFNGADNHFALAASKGLGTNKLADIKVLGTAVKDVMTKFASSR
jgi:predicted membrane chloride channel (bestrophin family)